MCQKCVVIKTLKVLKIHKSPSNGLVTMSFEAAGEAGWGSGQPFSSWSAFAREILLKSRPNARLLHKVTQGPRIEAS